MIDELVKTIRLHLSERLTSPLLGAFICSWILWNYRAVLIIASEEPVRRKLEFLHSIAFPDHGTAFLYGVLAPLATSLLYIFLYPLPARFVYNWSGKQRSLLLAIRRKNDSETLLTKEDTEKFRADFSKKEQEFYAQTEMRDREIDRLNSQIVRLTNEIDGLKKRVKTARSSGTSFELNSERARVLDTIQKLDESAFVAKISEAVSIDSLELEVLLNDIGSAGLVSGSSVTVNGRQRARFSLTSAGKKALVDARRQGLLANGG